MHVSTDITAGSLSTCGKRLVLSILMLVLSAWAGAGRCADGSPALSPGQAQTREGLDETTTIQQRQEHTTDRVPFPASASVLASCPSWAVATGSPCAKVLHHLQEFADEKRDPSWAEAVEARIREDITKKCPDCAVRALECRTSLCVAEVESTDGGFPYGSFVFDDVLRSMNVMPGTWLVGHEDLPSGNVLTLTLFMMGSRGLSWWYPSDDRMLGGSSPD